MAVRKRTILRAPTIPKEMTMLVLMASVTMAVSTVMPTRAMEKFRL